MQPADRSFGRLRRERGSPYRASASHYVAHGGTVPLADVTPEMLVRWKATLKRSTQSVAKCLVILHGIFKRAVKVCVIPRNPVASVNRPRDGFSTRRLAGFGRGGHRSSEITARSPRRQPGGEIIRGVGRPAKSLCLGG